MKVTGFDLKKSEKEGNTKAFGRIIIDDAFEVEVSVVEGKNGLFVSYPSKKSANGKWYSQFRILDRQVQDDVAEQVVYYFEKNVLPL